MANDQLILEMTCADIPGTFEKLSEWGLVITDVQLVDDLTVTFNLRRCDYAKIIQYAEKLGNTVKVRGKTGFLWTLDSLFRRPVLIVGLALLFAVFWLLPGRILIIEVEGNCTVPARQIMEAAERCGIGFGVSSRSVRSEKMKNALLSELPQLQWAGINTYGSRAVITVRERRQEESVPDSTQVSSIVAVRDGIILSCTVTQGTGLVTLGQAVTAGQVLISGYSDCGLKISATNAEGDIYALTNRFLTVKTDPNILLRTEYGVVREKISLIIGKKRINFYKGSGISDTTCVKMYSKYTLTLPGGFQLPVCLIREREMETILSEKKLEESSLQEQLQTAALGYLRQSMIAGVVTGKTESFSSESGYCISGQYQCEEMIGRVKPEEIGEYHGKTD